MSLSQDTSSRLQETCATATYSLSEVHSCTSFVLAEAGSPPSRDYIDGLIGKANNCTGWFECPDAELVGRMWTDRNTTITAKKKRLASQRREFMAWQAEPDNPTLIECRLGGQERDKNTGVVSNVPTRYKVRIIPLIHQTADESKADPYYNPADPGPAQNRAAARIWKREAAELGAVAKRKRGRRQPPTDAQNLKTILTLSHKYVGTAENQWERLQQLHQALDDEFIEEVPPPDTEPPGKLDSLQIIDDNQLKGGGGVILSLLPEQERSENGYVYSSGIPIFEPPVEDDSQPENELLEPAASLPVTHSLPTQFDADSGDYNARLEANFPTPEEAANWAKEGFESIDSGAPLEVFYLKDDAPKPKPIELLPVLRDYGEGFEKWVGEAHRKGWSLIARMTGKGADRERPIILVDDCTEADISRLRPFCFIQYQTSPGSYHVWLAVDCELQRFETIRTRLLTQLGRNSKANGGSFGSCRWPGSTNFKPEHKQADGSFPVVEPVYRKLGHWVTEADLDQHRLLAPEPAPRAEFPTELPDTSTDWWPDIEIEHARYKDDAGRHRSWAAARWVAIALKARHSRDAVKTKLYEVSEKAKERGQEWADETVDEVANYMGIS